MMRQTIYDAEARGQNFGQVSNAYIHIVDETNGKEVLKVLKFLNEEYKTTVIIVTHNPAIALISDKIIKMNSGKIVEIIKNEDKKPISELGWS